MIVSVEGGLVKVSGKKLNLFGWETLVGGTKEIDSEGNVVAFFQNKLGIKEVIENLKYLNNEISSANSLVFAYSAEDAEGYVLRYPSIIKGLGTIFSLLRKKVYEEQGESFVSFTRVEVLHEVIKLFKELNERGYLMQPPVEIEGEYFYAGHLDYDTLSGREMAGLVKKVLNNRSVLAGLNFEAYARESGILGTNVQELIVAKEVTEKITSLNKTLDNTDSLDGYRGSLEGLKAFPLEEVPVIKKNWLPGKKKSQLAGDKSIAGRMRKMGISNIYDLLTYYPLRHLDKSEVSSFGSLGKEDLNEPVNLVGKIVFSKSMVYGKGGAIFLLEDEMGKKVKVTFFNQPWLLSKFRVGDRVLVNGKVSYYNGDFGINGKTIDSLADATQMPVVPIYKQSQKNGISTNLILNSVKECLAMIDSIFEPTFLARKSEVNLKDVISKIHFPLNMKEFKSSIDILSYYEMVFMQIIIQKDLMDNSGVEGVEIKSVSGLQQECIEKLPFELTGSQRQGVEKINSLISSSIPSTILLNADVGAGKGLCLDEKLYVLEDAEWKLKKAGEIRVGDTLLGYGSQEMTVCKGVYPQPPQEIYVIKTSKGDVRTDGAHLWTVINPDNKAFTVSSEQLYKRGVQKVEEVSSSDFISTHKTIQANLDTKLMLPGDVSIIEVIKTDIVQKTVCFKVDSKNELYVLENGIVTHNTIVAQLGALQAIDAGYQSVLVAPTEILAKQLYNNSLKLEEMLKGKVRVGFLSSKMKAKEKKGVLEKIKEGELDLIVGTHSLLSESVEFENLGFVAIDEQQKFGAEQRTRLLSARKDGKKPHLLMQTATPIPRSTAQVFYGDIDMVLLDEKPPGREKIETELILSNHNEFVNDLINPVWEDVRSEASKGRQTFVITPLIEDSSSTDASSVKATFEALKDNGFKRVAMVHGKMKPDEQSIIMEDFRDGKYDVLVASTVVEVGVDIPNATRVVILSAERMGASSLHQIRGRVGRNSFKSKCYLVAKPREDGKPSKSIKRLQSLVEHENGFDIALSDLKLRGEGEIFGGNQSGKTGSIFISVLDNFDKIEEAKKEAGEILASEKSEEAINYCRERYGIQEGDKLK